MQTVIRGKYSEQKKVVEGLKSERPLDIFPDCGKKDRNGQGSGLRLRVGGVDLRLLRGLLFRHARSLALLQTELALVETVLTGNGVAEALLQQSLAADDELVVAGVVQHLLVTTVHGAATALVRPSLATVQTVAGRRQRVSDQQLRRKLAVLAHDLDGVQSLVEDRRALRHDGAVASDVLVRASVVQPRDVLSTQTAQ